MTMLQGTCLLAKDKDINNVDIALVRHMCMSPHQRFARVIYNYLVELFIAAVLLTILPFTASKRKKKVQTESRFLLCSLLFTSSRKAFAQGTEV